ncbi:MAG: hypothetical protein JNM56_08905 [Planctomycetia bacterium]|nr:hypothetical protein [Planctomycetia bacterium]
MYSRIMNVLNGLDSRYPTSEEEQEVLAYAESLPRRLDAANVVQQLEAQLIQEAIEQMKRRYPRFVTLHDRGWEKSYRDMQLCLRYAVQGMIVEDSEMPRRKLFIWLGTIIKAMGMTPKFAQDSYEILYEVSRQRLPAEVFALMEPYLKQLIVDMSSFLEPSKPAVG